MPKPGWRVLAMGGSVTPSVPYPVTYPIHHTAPYPRNGEWDSYGVSPPPSKWHTAICNMSHVLLFMVISMRYNMLTYIIQHIVHLSILSVDFHLCSCSCSTTHIMSSNIVYRHCVNVPCSKIRSIHSEPRMSCARKGICRGKTLHTRNHTIENPLDNATGNPLDKFQWKSTGKVTTLWNIPQESEN